MPLSSCVLGENASSDRYARDALAADHIAACPGCLESMSHSHALRKWRDQQTRTVAPRLQNQLRTRWCKPRKQPTTCSLTAANQYLWVSFYQHAWQLPKTASHFDWSTETCQIQQRCVSHMDEARKSGEWQNSTWPEQLVDNPISIRDALPALSVRSKTNTNDLSTHPAVFRPKKLAVLPVAQSSHKEKPWLSSHSTSCPLLDHTVPPTITASSPRGRTTRKAPAPKP